MKILIFKKKALFNAVIFITFIIIFLLLIYFFNIRNTKETLYPLDVSKNSEYDLNSDGCKDSIEIVEGQNKVDVKIKCNSKEFYLSNEINDNILFTKSNTLKTNIFIHNDSRSNIPKIILTGTKNEQPMSYIFEWNKNKQNFVVMYNNAKNILGIIDSKNTKTPQYFSIDSSKGRNSLDTFMIINNSLLNIDSDINSSYDTVLNFINIMQLPYDLDELPDIFSPSINRDELSLLWNLNKENYSYKFQNGFFYDYDWNDNNEPTCIKYRLSFKTEPILKQKGENKEYILLIDLTKSESTYKITSIQISK